MGTLGRSMKCTMTLRGVMETTIVMYPSRCLRSARYIPHAHFLPVYMSEYGVACMRCKERHRKYHNEQFGKHALRVCVCVCVCVC